MQWSIAALLVAGCSIDATGLAVTDAAAIDARVPADARATDGSPVDGRDDRDVGGDVDAGADAGDPRDAGFDAGPECPPRYAPNGFGTCYRDVTAADRWQAAEEDCERDGAHLVVVNDSAENAAVPNNRWIGYSETVSEGTFLWVTGAGASTFTQWGGTDPDRMADAYCVERRTDGWHDDNCFELKPYLCEHDGRPADPSTWNDSGRNP